MNVSLTNYHGKNANTRLVTIGSLDIYFSYETPIAFDSKSTGLVIRRNVWGPTTGKHLNAISTNKDIRIDGDDFIAQLEAISLKSLSGVGV